SSKFATAIGHNSIPASAAFSFSATSSEPLSTMCAKGSPGSTSPSKVRKTGRTASFRRLSEIAMSRIGCALSATLSQTPMVSKSRATDELFGLVGQLKRLGVPIIAVTGDPDSVLARQADVVLDASVTAEACPETLTPTTSTTVALALGDALAVTLLELKGF